jgi:hypothetical protein
MVGMPDWFAKTKEMLAADLWFSLAGAGSEAALVERYEAALQRLAGTPTDYPHGADALGGYTWTAASIDDHFVGDWIHYRYYQDQVMFGSSGGDFWPQIASSRVINMLRTGVQIAIHKALGASYVTSIGGMTDKYFHDLFGPELANGVDLDGVRSLAMSWVCVAPAGSDYFEVAAARGPTVVEFAIGTPKPFEHSPMQDVAIKLIDGYYKSDDDSPS